jgi:A/G-specific adenine glycosylase
VIPYYRRFMDRFPDLETLAAADLQEVLKLWEGLGYYARARNLHRAAQLVMEKHRGVIPSDPARFQELPGVGAYISAAVSSIAFHRPHAVVDGNVKRVLARLHRIEIPVNGPTGAKVFRETAAALLDPKAPGRFNQAMMELGALVCKPRNPNCNQCPLTAVCLSFQADETDQYPKRAQRKPIPEHHVAVGVVFKKGKFLITRRPSQGLLGGLWEFPGGKLKPGESAEAACLREIREEVNLTIEIASPLTRVKHAYTHFKVLMDVFCCRHVRGRIRLKGPVDYRWITLKEIENYPFPGANHKFIPLLKSAAENQDIIGQD